MYGSSWLLLFPSSALPPWLPLLVALLLLLPAAGAGWTCSLRPPSLPRLPSLPSTVMPRAAGQGVERCRAAEAHPLCPDGQGEVHDDPHHRQDHQAAHGPALLPACMHSPQVGSLLEQNSRRTGLGAAWLKDSCL